MSVACRYKRFTMPNVIIGRMSRWLNDCGRRGREGQEKLVNRSSKERLRRLPTKKDRHNAECVVLFLCAFGETLRESQEEENRMGDRSKVPGVPMRVRLGIEEYTLFDRSIQGRYREDTRKWWLRIILFGGRGVTSRRENLPRLSNRGSGRAARSPWSDRLPR